MEYLEDGFADIKYFEASQRFTYIHLLEVPKYLTFNFGAAQRLAEPYGYDPLEEWVLSNNNLHYTFLAIQEGYDYGSLMVKEVWNTLDPSGEFSRNKS